MIDRAFLNRTLHIFVLVGFAVSQPIFGTLSEYPEFFIATKSKPFEIILILLSISLLLPIIIVLPQIFIQIIKPRISLYFHYIILSIFAALFLLTILRYLDINRDLSVIILAIIFGVSFGLLYRKYKTIQKYMTYLSPSIIIFPLIFIFQAPVQKVLLPQSSELIAQKIDPGEALPSIVMVVLDEVNITDLMDSNRMIDENLFPNFARLSKMSYWFRNATSVSSMTMTAIPAMLTGRYVEENIQLLPIFQDYPNNLFVAIQATHNLNVIEAVTTLCPSNLCQSDSGTNTNMERFVGLFSDIFILYFHIVTPDRFNNFLPDISHQWANFAEGEDPRRPDSEKSQFTEKDFNLRIKTELKGDRALIFRNFVNSIKVSEQPTFHFLHILLPHGPFEYLPGGKKYRRHRLEGLANKKWGDDEWAVYLGWQRSLLQLAYTDKLIGELLDHLIRETLIDDIVLIVTADHGANFSTNEFRKVLEYSNFHNLSPIPLFIKVRNQKKGIVSDKEVETIDIVPTIQDILGTPFSIKFDGESLFEMKSRMTKIIYRNRGRVNYKFPASSFEKKYDTLRERLNIFGNNYVPNQLFYLGSFSKLDGTNILDQGIGVSGDISFSIIKPKKILIGDGTRARPGLVKGHLYIQQPVASRIDLLFSVNNKIVSGTKTLHAVKGGGYPFIFLIPESAYDQEENILNILKVRETENGKIYLEILRPISR
ncbi:MAG: sulfatase-like hydrolase/transferase [SAR324 cluster bacterium]|nr:sulfatase-like hydrolase/transferase [SAR324 cluster bacterium]